MVAYMKVQVQVHGGRWDRRPVCESVRLDFIFEFKIKFYYTLQN